MKPYSKSRAFTIVEMVIVIAVVAILMTIMFVGGSAISRTAKKSSIQSDLRTCEVNLCATLADEDMVNEVIASRGGIIPASEGVLGTVESIKGVINRYFEDDMKIVSVLDVSEDGQNWKIKYILDRKDPYGMPYTLEVENMSSAGITTDYLFTVKSYGGNKSTFVGTLTEDTSYSVDGDDAVAQVQYKNSVVDTRITFCSSKGVQNTDNLSCFYAVSSLTISKTTVIIVPTTSELIFGHINVFGDIETVENLASTTGLHDYTYMGTTYDGGVEDGVIFYDATEPYFYLYMDVYGPQGGWLAQDTPADLIGATSLPVARSEIMGKPVTTIDLGTSYTWTSISGIPSSVTFISLTNNTNITSITIPAAVNDVYIQNCPSLANIYYEGTMSQYISISKTISGVATSVVHCSDGNMIIH